MDSLLEHFYDQLILATIKQNRMYEEQRGIKQTNFDKLYKKTAIPFKEDRQLTIRWVKVPTFSLENELSFYAAFLVSIDFWRKGEIKTLYRQIIESIDAQNVDSFTIFLMGRLYGYIDKMDRRPRYYHIYRINTNEFTERERKRVLDCICNFLEDRIHEMSKNGMTLESVRLDADRIRYFIDTFRYMRVVMRTRVNDSNTSNRKNEVLANTKSNTSNSNIIHYNAHRENLFEGAREKK